MWPYHILYWLYRYTFVIKMNSPCHFSFYLHLSVIAIKLSLQTFILPQIKILKYHWSKTYCIKPYHIMLITSWHEFSLFFPSTPTHMICWPNIKSINTHVSIWHKIKVLKYWQKLILLLFILSKSIYIWKIISKKY